MKRKKNYIWKQLLRPDGFLFFQELDIINSIALYVCKEPHLCVHCIIMHL